MAKKLFGKTHFQQMWLLGKAIVRTPIDFLKDAAAGHLPPQSGNQFQYHPHHTPFPTKRPFSNNSIGPPLPLAMRVIMILSTNFGL